MTTPEISLREITSENWEAVIRLQVTKEQENFVAPNPYSMLEAHFTGGEARAIYADETLVGFTYYGFDEKERNAEVTRFMIALPFQGKGYGRVAIQHIINLCKSQPFVEAVYLSFVPENIVAKALYESVGFRDTGEVDDGEIVYRLALKAG